MISDPEQEAEPHNDGDALEEAQEEAAEEREQEGGYQ